MKLLVTIAVTALAGAACAQAADDPFVGTWKLNADKSQVAGFREDIKDVGGNRYEFKFGDDVEMIVADGADHPLKWGGTWALKQDGPNKWTETFKRDGKVTSVTTLNFSDDGNTLHIVIEGKRADGSSFSQTMDAKRIGGGSGIAGTWESTKIDMPAPTDWVIKPWGADGLSFASPADKEHLDIKFDGKDYVDKGPRVSPGNSSSAKRTDPNTIELTDKLKGKVVDTEDLKVSEDGKTMTVDLHNAGVEKPMVFVYQKQ